MPRFVDGCRTLDITPHVAQYEHRSSAIDALTTRHEGYRISQRIRKRAAYDLLRIAKLKAV